jgi:Bacterial fructose-1,6-bisphosphatase, glpX-encoded
MSVRPMRHRDTPSPRPSSRGGSGSIIGLRLGALDFMRATEQTAVLLSRAAGRKLPASTQSQLAIRSIGAFLRASLYRMRLIGYDHQSGRGECLRLWQSLGFFSRTRTGRSPEPGCLAGPAAGYLVRPVIGAEYVHMSRGAALPYGPDDHMSLDLCVSPVDGQRALAQGLTGGSAVVLAAGSPGTFCGDRLPGVRHDQPADPEAEREVPHDQPYFMIVMGPHVWERFREAKGDASRWWQVPEVAAAMQRHAKRRGGDGFKACVEAIITRREFETALDNDDDDIALLDEEHLRLWDGAVSATRSCRLFPGSAVALAIATFRGDYGFHCMMGVAEHVQACQIAVAARALGGGFVAFPVERERRANGNAAGLRFEPWAGVTHEWFASSEDCVLSCSGISSHCIFDGVRNAGSPKSGRKSVVTVCLSARTGSYRTLEHEILLKGTRWCSLPPRSVDQGNARNPGWRNGAQLYDDFAAEIENYLLDQPEA